MNGIFLDQSLGRPDLKLLLICLFEMCRWRGDVLDVLRKWQILSILDLLLYVEASISAGSYLLELSGKCVLTSKWWYVFC